MYFFLTIFETLISLYWLLNGILFYEARYYIYKIRALSQKCELCFFNSLTSIFIQYLDWIFFSFCLHNLECLIDDPFSENRFQTRLRWYMFISLGSSGGFTYLIFVSRIYGVSVKLYFIIIFSRCLLALLKISSQMII